MTSYYRIFCETDNKWEYLWTTEEPTQCPIDNGHTVNSNSISKYSSEPNIIQVSVTNAFSKNTLSTTTNFEITSFLYPGVNEMGFLKKIEITFSMDNNGSTGEGDVDFGFYITLRDLTNNATLYESGQIPGTEVISSYTENLDIICPDTPSTWCILLKKAPSSGNINIRHIALFFYKV